jgi:DNA-directed RNA polymerase sigma subunit (sigma70/sigma32)
MDLQYISGLLRQLSPRQEKVIRLFFGLGCQRPHSAREVAQEWQVSVQSIAALLGAAQRRLAQAGLTCSQLRQAARAEAGLRPLPWPVQEATITGGRHIGWHRRC